MKIRKFTIRWSAQARSMLLGISDRRIRQKIFEKVTDLKEEPQKQGKPLTGELLGYWSLRAVGQRFRIIYRIEEDGLTVWVVALGIRKEGSRRDIYALARKLMKLRLLD